MESDNSTNSDDSQSNNSSQSASPETVTREQSVSGSPSASSHNSAPQSPDNNSSGSQSIDNGIQSPEQDNDDDEDDDDPQSPDSSSSKSKSPVVEPCSPEHQQNDEPQSPSSESSSSSRVSSTAGSPDRNSHSRPSSKVSSRSNESDKETKEPHDNYLSDVSDEDSMDNINDDNASQKSAKEWKSDNDTHSPSKEIVIPVNGHNNVDAKIEPNVVNDPEEPLDFEAEDGEDGECDEPKPVKDETEVEEEKEPEELEEGEVSDEGEHRPEETEPRPICRFYSRGQCTWGASCRFLHPGVADKGNYSMFEMVRPIPPPGSLPSFYPNDSYRTHERTLIPGGPIAPIKKDDIPPVETAWERGLRQAKEILKKSNKKKETDIDFEEKKMNLTSNQEEVEKENDYYAQRPTSPTASPALSPPIERFKPDLEARHHRGPPPDAYVDEFMPPQVDFYHHRPEFWPPHHGRPLPHFPPGHPIDFHAPPRRNPYYPYPPPEPYYHPGLKPHHRGLPPKYPPNREVIMQRSEKSYSPQPSGHRNRRDRSSSRPRRGDDWSDPWMRSKSPGGRSKLRGRKKSYSSHSSFSSSSNVNRSSSSSSNSSYSSRSRSRGRSNSITKNRKKAPPLSFKTSPGRKTSRKPERNPSPDAFDKKPMSRSMNPPVPTNRWSVSPTNTPASIQPVQRARQMPMPPRFAVNKSSGVKSPATTHTSSSSSSSESASGSGSSESSDSSGSESSSEGGSPKQKKLGLSPNKLLKKKMQKAEMKLNKKKMAAPIVPSVKKEKSISQGKKRSLESDNDDTKSSSPPRKKGGAAPSRREELLKQLKAVEDAIARKKSKVAL
ncbi:zinc finger CCCH domain-containing protein 18 isoform X1 [Rhopalosiphum maidis]|uniref:zinc finger CCCH domain-containing protein 18 isoform X1 n=1 Tax=Rhopalosiphum maidis TaxID=43146 RepID=UPI000EFE7586|nr:zinc finger CCCH domain-containing protein 18 isoform X1 [Rhopalosiphum maidis]XP_026813570.1 zinc finger CCCH domain-containing protein 18 isoform X1 [Rhopalosiphum maidis]